MRTKQESNLLRKMLKTSSNMLQADLSIQIEESSRSNWWSILLLVLHTVHEAHGKIGSGREIPIGKKSKFVVCALWHCSNKSTIAWFYLDSILESYSIKLHMCVSVVPLFRLYINPPCVTSNAQITQTNKMTL